MTCHATRELFSALVDDALTAAERGDLEAHLGGCAECRRELERFQSTVSLLHRVEPARAPAGFVDRVLAAARPAPWHRRVLRAVFLPWPVKLPLEAAALVLVGVTVALLFQGAPELQQAARLETRPSAVSEAPPRPAPEPTAAPSEPAVTAPQPAAPRFAAPAPSIAPAPPPEKKTAPSEAEVASRLQARPEPAPAVSDRREAVERRDEARRREGEALKSKDEADAVRRQDAAKAARAPAASAPAAPGETKGAEAPGGVVAGRAGERLSVARAAPTGADVAGRLSVADRDAALRALAGLVARAGGREVARRAIPDGLAVELAIPRAAWPEFSRELARLGRFSPERETGELPDDVRLSLRITD